MNITHYSFGRIIVGDKEYKQDVIIFPDRVQASWWRRDGHSLVPEDLSEVLSMPPQVLVIGTGYSGVMKVPEATLKFLKSKGIEVHVQRTPAAVDLYNHLSSDRNVVAALHLTC